MIAGLRVAVTGASGYIGASLVPYLCAQGASVTTVTRRPIQWPAGVDAVVGDVSSPAVARTLISTADMVIHLAGLTSLRAVEDDPRASLDGTVMPLVHLAAAAAASGRHPRVILASSATVYGLTPALPVDETCRPQPITAYDQHKWWAEQQLEFASRAGVLDAIVLRLANVYGPSPAPNVNGRGFVNGAAASALSGTPLTQFGDGSCLRDFVHVHDVNAAFAAALSAQHRGFACYNVGSGRGTTIGEALVKVADAAAGLTGRRVQIEQAPWPDTAHAIDRRSFVADNARIAAALGWRPSMAFDDGIETLMARRPCEEVAAAPLKLNLGCGGRPLPGYVNIDMDSLASIHARYPDRAIDPASRVEQHDVFTLPFADATADEVRADSLIEHLSFVEEPRFFVEVIRVLTPGGRLILSTVDLEATAREWLDAPDDWRDFYRTDAEAIRTQHWFGTHTVAPVNRWGYLTATLFGNQNGAGQFHQNGYTRAKLVAICARLGLVVESIEPFRWQGDRDAMLALVARKP